MIMSSMHNLLLDKCVLVHLGDVLPGVDLVVTGLGEWHNQTSAEAAAGKHCHDAEVEQKGAASVHLLGA